MPRRSQKEMTMQFFGTVVADELAIRAQPGGKIIGHLDQNIRVELDGEAVVHPGATWWKLKGRDGYAAEKNASGQVFMRIEKLVPKAPPMPVEPEQPSIWRFVIGVAVFIAFCVGAFIWAKGG